MNDIQKIIEHEEKLFTYDGDDKVVSSHKMYKNLSETYKNKKIVSMPSGIPSIDKYITGFDGGELTVISGPTGNGKTLLAQTLTADFAEQDKHSIWFTYEVPAWQFLRQFGELTPKFFMPQSLTGNSLDWVYQRCHEAKLKYGLDAVFIDHLHFLIDMNRHNISLEIGHVMRTLKKMALSLNVAVFLIAHVAKSKQDTEIDIGDIRDSAMVGCESDNVFFVWRKKGTDSEAVVKIAKNRRCGIMGKKINLMKVGNYLREVEIDRQ